MLEIIKIVFDNVVNIVYSEYITSKQREYKMNQVHIISELRAYKYTVFANINGMHIWSFEYFRTEAEAQVFAAKWIA